MGAAKPKTYDREEIVARLMDGHYDQVLADFQTQLDAATAALRQAYEALRRENTLVS